MAVRVVADGSEDRCRWRRGSLQMAVRVVESVLNMERLVSGHSSISHDNRLRDPGGGGAA